MRPALILDGVAKRFGDVVAVDSVSLEVPRGAIYGFIGPNGAGKTTTIRMIMSILYPDAGAITVLDSSNPEAVKDRLGYLPEEKGLYKKMRTGELLTYFARLKGMGRSDARARARRLLEEFGLGDWVDRKSEALSKGMSQKVQILGTLMHNPDLVILDEPFAGLDPVNVELVRNVILDVRRDGRTVIFSTHVMEQAEQLCDYIFLIHRGRKVLDGTLHDVRRSGEACIAVDFEGDGAGLHGLPGVRRVTDRGKTAELFLEEGADPQALLKLLVERFTVRRFDMREPSLHEVFIRAVGAKTDA